MTKRGGEVAGRGATWGWRLEGWRVFLPQKGKKHDNPKDERQPHDDGENAHESKKHKQGRDQR